jgi:hypothetical protein
MGRRRYLRRGAARWPAIRLTGSTLRPLLAAVFSPKCSRHSRFDYASIGRFKSLCETGETTVSIRRGDRVFGSASRLLRATRLTYGLHLRGLAHDRETPPGTRNQCYPAPTSSCTLYAEVLLHRNYGQYSKGRRVQPDLPSEVTIGLERPNNLQTTSPSPAGMCLSV